MTKHWKKSILTAVAALFALGFAGALVQREAGVLFSEEVRFSPRPSGELFRMKGDHYVGGLPKRHRTTLAAQHGAVLEDGVPLPVAESSITKVDEGFGRFRMTDGYAHFTATDNSDPNTNGRTYTLRVPYKVRDRVLWWLFAGLAASLFFATRHGSRLALPETSPEAGRWEVLGVFALSLGFAVWAHFAYAEFSDGGLCVLGKPYSDAIGWHEFAIFLKEGLGFSSGYSSSRPFYPIFQSIVFLFAGDSLAAAQWTNVFLLAVTGAFIYLGGRIAFPRSVAAATLAFFLVAPEYHRMAPSLLSELPGLAFGAIGFYLFVRAYAGRKAQRRLYFLAGVFLALSNLSRPYTLIALPFLGAIPLFLLGTRKLSWRQFVLNLAMLALGSILVMLPWSLRQKAVNDTFTISLNSSELLYGAAMPDGPGRWNDGQFEEARAAGIDTRDKKAVAHWFSKRFRETVSEDPGRYAGFLWGKFSEYVSRFSLNDTSVRMVIVSLAALLLVAACFTHRSVVPLALLPPLFPLWKWIATWPGWASIPVAAVLVVLLGGRRARIGVFTVVAFLVGGGILSAMTGNFAYKRGIPIVQWMFVLLVAAAVVYALQFLVGRLAKHVLRQEPEVARPRAPEPLARWTGTPAFFVYGLCSFIVLGLAVLGLRTAFAERSDARLVTLPADARAEAIALAFEGRDGPEDASLVFCEVVAVNDYRWELGPSQETGHWSRLYERRPYARTAALMEVGVRHHPSAPRYALQCAGSLEATRPGRPHVVVGIVNFDEHAFAGHERTMIEALAIIPWDEASQKLQPGKVLRFPPTPEAEAILGSAASRSK